MERAFDILTDSDILPDGLLENFDVQLQNFYHKALNTEIDLSQSGNILQIRRALREVVGAYRKKTVDSCSSRINFDTPAKRCAYVFKHCPCFTSAVAKHWFRLLKVHPSILHEPIEKEQLNLCCLGGGPASDAVGIIKVITGILSKKDVHYLNLHITIIDLSKNWEVTAKNVIQTLQETSSFFDSEKILLEFQFLTADLTQKWSKKVDEAIRNADLITMVYFLSAVNGSKVKDKSPHMLQKIMEGLKAGALLFYLDSAKDLHYEGISAVAQTFSDLNQIYGPRIQEFHTLSIESLKKFLEIYSTYFHMYLCLSNCFISCSVWQKTKVFQRTILTSEVEVHLRHCRNLVKSKEDHNTKKMISFREKVNRLLLTEFDLLYYLYYSDENEETESSLDLTESYGNFAKMLCYPTKSKCKRIYANS